MNSGENTSIVSTNDTNAGELNPNEKINGEEQAPPETPKEKSNNQPEPDPPKAPPKNETTEDKKKGKHKNGIPSINLSALRELEGATTSSFVDLAKAVIMVDGIPYDKDILPMSKARKIDFERLIAHHAQLEIYGNRKYHIKSVYNRIQKDIDSDVELKITKKLSYNKPKQLTEAQRKAQKMLYEARKEKEKREKAESERIILEKAQEKLLELESVTATTQNTPKKSE